MDNSIIMTITDDDNSVTYGLLEVPLTMELVDGKTDVTTLSGDQYSYVMYTGKRQISHTWSYMTESEYNQLLGFERRQYSNRKRPRLTISRLGIEDAPVVMSVSARKVVNNCGMVSDVTVTFRDTVQASVGVD